MADNLELKADELIAKWEGFADRLQGGPFEESFEADVRALIELAKSARTSTPPVGDVVERVARAVLPAMSEMCAGACASLPCACAQEIATAALAAGSGERMHLRDALTTARSAIASLPEDALGMDDRQNHLCDPHPPYPIRDELLATIDAALNEQEG